MSALYKSLIKPVLFTLSPENAHYFTFNILKKFLKLPACQKLVSTYYTVNNEKLATTIFGLQFNNPVGLAAGFDKDGKLIDELAAFGFGFVEVGTVTPLPQKGNDKPRLFRLLNDNALINRMGFNNEGVDALVERLKKVKNKNVIIGGNIGKNKVTPNESAVNDYKICFEKLFDHVHYFVVNVSSPNTPDLRALQEKEPLLHLLSSLQELNAQLAKQKNTILKPVLLKIAPDLNEGQLDDIIDIVYQTRIAGIVATNTTISREGLLTPAEKIAAIGTGGLSGRPVKNRSTEVIRYIHHTSEGKIPVIGVGGIFDGKDAKEKLEAGASLVQIYTGFIYEGPMIVKRICNHLINN